MKLLSMSLVVGAAILLLTSCGGGSGSSQNNDASNNQQVVTQCDIGFSFNTDSEQCVQDVVEIVCDAGTTLDVSTGQCVAMCDVGFSFDEASQQCVENVIEVVCGAGTALDALSGQCVSLCSDIQEWNDVIDSCVDLYWVCESGTRYPGGFIPDENSTQSDCIYIPYHGPFPIYAPVQDEVVIFINRQHIDADYSGINIYRWGDCWVDGGTPAWPGEMVQRLGIDPTYGAYYTFEILSDEEPCNAINFMVNIGGDANKTHDLSFPLAEDSEYARMFFILPGENGQFSSSAGATFGGGDSDPVCFGYESTGGCIAPAPPP